MTSTMSSTQIGAAQPTQQQGQAGTSGAPAQQGGQHSGAGQMQQSGQTPPRFTDWASI